VGPQAEVELGRALPEHVGPLAAAHRIGLVEKRGRLHPMACVTIAKSFGASGSDTRAGPRSIVVGASTRSRPRLSTHSVRPLAKSMSMRVKRPAFRPAQCAINALAPSRSRATTRPNAWP